MNTDQAITNDEWVDGLREFGRILKVATGKTERGATVEISVTHGGMWIGRIGMMRWVDEFQDQAFFLHGVLFGRTQMDPMHHHPRETAAKLRELIETARVPVNPRWEMVSQAVTSLAKIDGVDVDQAEKIALEHHWVRDPDEIGDHLRVDFGSRLPRGVVTLSIDWKASGRWRRENVDVSMAIEEVPVPPMEFSSIDDAVARVNQIAGDKVLLTRIVTARAGAVAESEIAEMTLEHLASQDVRIREDCCRGHSSAE